MLSGVKFIPRDQLNTEKKKKSRKHKKRKNSKSDDGSSTSESEHELERSKKHKSKQRKEKGRKKADSGDDISDKNGGGSTLNKEKDLARKGMGLEWMLKPGNNEKRPVQKFNDPPEEIQVDEVKKPNPRELNPYFKDDGTGYPEEDSAQTNTGANHLRSSSVVGDGGASWRLKALKRAQEQAARDGTKLEEVVGERWGSLSQLAVSAASRAAPIRAHLHAINDRKRMVMKSQDNASEDQIKPDTEEAQCGNRDYLRDVSVRRPEMRQPKVHDSLSWRKRKEQVMSAEDAQLIASATASMNKFANDGSFIREAGFDQKKDADDTSHRNQDVASEMTKLSEQVPTVSDGLSANQLAAKAMQLRMKGRHDEADKLLEKIEMMKMKQDNGSNATEHGSKGTASRYAKQEPSLHKKEREENADRNLAQNIMRNKQFSISGRADDEYDFDDGPSGKRNKKRAVAPEKPSENSGIGRRITILQESCQFCLENPSRRKHLTISIADATYLMLPPWQPVVEGHCCILPAQHDSATRNVDNHIWEEIRNFKKCLIRMFATQDKEVVFLETVTGLAQQRRHCLVECIPLPQEIAKQAPLYFKKAIDEAEDEWSQHNAKKLIDTSVKGLRGSIPKDFPYFHVEFGLNKGFVHVIDDEKQFKTNLGLNVIRGMLQLPEEDMYRRRKQDSPETQSQAVARFRRNWEPFDWTKQLE